jgi:hypothetical protein
MRPTWHFLAPQDIRAVLALTAHRVRAGSAAMHRKLELDGRLLSRCHRTLTAALGGRQHLTRAELAARLQAARIQAEGQRLAYILMDAEFAALICSGPRKGRQFTYALLEERVPKTRALSPEEALGRWTLRYFLGHGPAQAKDFAWWSGLTLREAQRGIELAKGSLLRETIDGNTYWRSPGGDGREPDGGRPGGGGGALLLSIYDEYTIAYRDRGALGDGRRLERLISMGNALTSVLILGGIIAGTWKRVLARAGVELTVSPFRALRRAEKEAIRAAASAYGQFLGLPADLRFTAAPLDAGRAGQKPAGHRGPP